ncbi:MAG: hypothetical protein M1450_04925 [Patescibacteria group bacterium]|nr:hypothetical protein [Patescibacteria group bacterium]
MNIKYKIATALATGSLLAAIVLPKAAFADSLSVNFESSTYSLGSISGQDGWSNAVNPVYDQDVVTNTFGYTAFGGQSFRISDAVASGSFGDWVFAKPLTDSVGETAATNGTFSPGTKQNHFEMQFDIASTQTTQQPSMHISISPDRGDGSRMSYLRFEDNESGIDVFFDDVTDAGPLGTVATFNESNIATISRSPHAIKLTLDTLDGPANDVVKVYIDGVLKKTGTSWEDYYRFDPEAIAEQSPRIVKTVIFQARGSSTPADEGKGFLIDNLSLLSSPIPVDPFAIPEQCKNIEGLGAPIIGTSGSDKINGTSGNDLIFGLGGSDKIDGKGGNDCIVGGDGSDKLIGGDGNDVILGGNGSDAIEGGKGNDELYGEAGSDSLKGGDGNDKLYGGDGSDSLQGDNGNDILDGGNGSDSAKGGPGTDTCTAESTKQCE